MDDRVTTPALLHPIEDALRHTLDCLSGVAVPPHLYREEGRALQHLQLFMLRVVPARRLAKAGETFMTLLRTHRLIRYGLSRRKMHDVQMDFVQSRPCELTA